VSHERVLLLRAKNLRDGIRQLVIGKNIGVLTFIDLLAARREVFRFDRWRRNDALN
jgi:hypothetical protein